MTKPVVELHSVARSFGGIKAVRDVSFKLAEGEIVGLIGPNGAGKTTLVNCITGVHTPSAGRVIFDGKDVTNQKPFQAARSGLCRTFQIVQPFPEMTVLQNVAAGALFGNKISRLSQAYDAAHEYLDFVGIDQFADMPASTLTLANRKRLELAKSLAMKPRVLMLDEVNAGLNSAEINGALELIQKISERGVSIIVIEHLMKVIMTLSQRIIVLHHGELIAEGDPHQVVNDSKVIEAYLGQKFAKRLKETTMAEPLLNISGLTAGYGDVQVLWGIDLMVNEGEIACLVGSNGAGKTTLMRTISGICDTTGGSVRFDGADLTSASANAILSAGIAHVPEGRRLFRGLSVRDNLLLGAYLRHDHQAIEDDLERVYDLFPILRERHNQDATTMSGGQQQMCAIARGIMSRPKLLMIDELSLGLAPKLVEELAEALIEINQQGTTIVVVEQDVMTAFEMAEHAFVVETGKIVKAGLTKDLSDDPIIREAYLGM